MTRFYLAIAGVFLLTMIAYTAPIIEQEPHLPEPLFEPLQKPQNAPQSDEKAQDVQTTITNQIYCSCVKTARLLGAPLPYGNASQLIPNATPAVGGVVILRYPNAYHVAYIKALYPDGMLVAEGNYRHCEYTERLLPYTYQYIVGFWQN